MWLLPTARRAFCGMHAINNYLRGDYVTRDDGVRAHRINIADFQIPFGGCGGIWIAHMILATGWLSIDVMQVLGATNCGLHIERERRCSLLDVCDKRTLAVFTTGGSRQWVVLERGHVQDGGRHTHNMFRCRRIHCRELFLGRFGVGVADC